MISKGLLNLTEAYIEYGKKCEIIFTAQKNIVLQVHTGKSMTDKGAEQNSSLCSVAAAKEKLKMFKQRNENKEPHTASLPPPYSENPPYNPFYNELSNNYGPPSNDFSKDQNRPRPVLDKKLPQATSNHSLQHPENTHTPTPQPWTASVPIPKPRNSFLFYPNL